MIVLGIETSCDETAASVVSEAGVLADVVHTQQVHLKFGGVVPELASRAHVEKMVTVTRAALEEAGVVRPDAIAATAGPGLIGAVLVGLSFAKGLAAAYGVPFVGVNHLEGHLLSAGLDDPKFRWPFLALIVSGGHTTLYHARSYRDTVVLGTTVDDAVGEAYDKVARMMGLPYPGGPHVDKLATMGDPCAIKFPRPRAPGMNFSFSGLKTAVRKYLTEPNRGSDADVAASFQAAVIDCLLARVKLGVKETGCTRLVLGGGVAANGGLRAAVSELDLDVFLPKRSRCTDNAAMIAHAGRLRLLAGEEDPLTMPAQSNWAVA
jgi:N6-L-threonylcarbamoyladenine synthase